MRPRDFRNPNQMCFPSTTKSSKQQSRAIAIFCRSLTLTGECRCCSQSAKVCIGIPVIVASFSLVICFSSRMCRILSTSQNNFYYLLSLFDIFYIILHKIQQLWSKKMHQDIMIKPLPLKFVVYLSKFVIIQVNILFCFLRPSGCMIFYFYRGCFSAGYRVIPDM